MLKNLNLFEIGFICCPFEEKEIQIIKYNNDVYIGEFKEFNSGLGLIIYHTGEILIGKFNNKLNGDVM